MVVGDHFPEQVSCYQSKRCQIRTERYLVSTATELTIVRSRPGSMPGSHNRVMGSFHQLQLGHAANDEAGSVIGESQNADRSTLLVGMKFRCDRKAIGFDTQLNNPGDAAALSVAVRIGRAIKTIFMYHHPERMLFLG